MKVLYVTTFNQRLYDLTGKNLVKTFMENIKDADLLVCPEEMDFVSPSERIKVFDIGKSKYFTNWLEDNKKNIPKFYGGLAEDKDPRFVLDDKKGQGWARFRASRYFRKVAAFQIALDKYSDDYDMIILTDSDVIFKKDIDQEKIDELFAGDISMFYFWGKHRKKINRGPESGFTGWMKKNNGFEFGKKFCDCFRSGDFLKYEYWDDGFVLGRLITENKSNYKFKDIVDGFPIRTTRVMEIKGNALIDYIHHFKNTHQY